jgi:hypothetical protein
VSPSEKNCPICKQKNAYTALACSNCGALLEENPTNVVAIGEATTTGGLPNIENVGSFIDMALVPEGGVGIYIAGAFKPYYVHIYKELIIGRQADATLEAVFDLSDLDGFNMGVSRRHAMIRRTETGFEVVDLSSRNGTWLNAEKLMPNKPYPFASGSQLRVGQMRLFILYHTVLNATQKK